MFTWLQEKLDHALAVSSRLPPEKQKADVVIGVSAGLKDDGSLSWQSEMIADIAIDARKNLARNLLFSGRGNPSLRPASEVMVVYALDKMDLHTFNPGKEGFLIHLESSAEDTHRQAINTLSTMRKNKWKSAILVVHSVRSSRVYQVFRQVWPKEFEIFIIPAFTSYGGNAEKKYDSFWRMLAYEFFCGM